jgi:hypothetical protein
VRIALVCILCLTNSLYADNPAQIAEKIKGLEQQIVDARMLDTRPEQVTLEIARLFVGYILWDQDNHKKLSASIADSGLTKAEADEAATALPQREARQVIDMLDRATARLAHLQEHPESRRLPDPIAWDQIHLKDSRFHSGDRTVYPGGFGKISDIDDLEIVAALGSAFAGTLATPDGIIKEDGVPSHYAIERTGRRFKHDANSGMRSELVLSHTTKTSIENRFPGFRDVKAGSIGYDIDHPDVRNMWNQTLRAIAPQAQQNSNFFAYRLVTDPSIPPDAGVSAHTISKYRAWLQQQYLTITDLNTHWGTTRKSYDHIKQPVFKKAGAGEWHDWCRFNQYRVSAWLSMLKEVSGIHHPDTLAYPILPECFKTGDATKGSKSSPALSGLNLEGIAIDFEAVGLRLPTPIQSDGLYAVGWQRAAATVDFMRSAAPETTLLAADWDALGSAQIDAVPGHLRSAMWMLYLRGIAGSQVAWMRSESKPASANTGQFYGSLQTQPHMLNEYAQTLLEINAWTPQIELFRARRSLIHLLYSPASSMQSDHHVNALIMCYDALVQLGIGVDFVTESQLTSGPIKSRWIVVPEAAYVSTKTITALEKFSTLGFVSFVGKCLSYDPHARPHASESMGFTDTVHKIDVTTPHELHLAFDEILPKTKVRRRMRCVGGNGKPLTGLVWRQAPWRDGVLVAITNVRREPVRAMFKIGDTPMLSAYDLIAAKTRKMKPFPLRPYDVHLLYFASEENIRKQAIALARSNPARKKRNLPETVEEAAVAEAEKVDDRVHLIASMTFEPPRKLIELSSDYALYYMQKAELRRRLKHDKKNNKLRRLLDKYTRKSKGLKADTARQAEKLEKRTVRKHKTARRKVKVLDPEKTEPAVREDAQGEVKRLKLIVDACRGDLDASQGKPKISCHSLRKRNAPKLFGRDFKNEVYKAWHHIGTKYVVATFWSSQNPRSVAEVKMLATLAQRFEEKPVDFLAINLGDDQATITEALGTLPENLKILQAMQPEQKRHKDIIEAYKLKILPTTVLVDRRGTVDLMLVGSSYKNNRRVIERLYLLFDGHEEEEQ